MGHESSRLSKACTISNIISDVITCIENTNHSTGHISRNVIANYKEKISLRFDLQLILIVQ